MLINNLYQNDENIVISVIVPLFKNKESIKSQIRSWTYEPNTEIIYVDDCCPNNSQGSVIKTWKEKVKKQNAKIISLTKNSGISQACNIGTQYAKGKILIFLHGDVQTTENWIIPLVNSLGDNTGAVSNLQLKDGIIDNAGFQWKWGKLDFEPVLNNTDIQFLPKQEISEVESINNRCFCIKKELFDYIGGFNTNYRGSTWEDIELSLTIREKGFKILYNPNSRIYSPEPNFHKFQEHNKMYFLNKWVKSHRIDNLVKDKRDFKNPVENILIKGETKEVKQFLFEKYPNCKIFKSNQDENILARDYDLFYDLEDAIKRRPNVDKNIVYREEIGASGLHRENL